MLGSLGEPREGSGPQELPLLHRPRRPHLPGGPSALQVHDLGHCTSPGPPGRPPGHPATSSRPHLPAPGGGARAVPPPEGAGWGAVAPQLPPGSTPNPPPNLNISLAAAVRAIYHANVGAPAPGRAGARAGERRPVGGPDRGICNIFLRALESFTNATAATPGTASRRTDGFIGSLETSSRVLLFETKCQPVSDLPAPRLTSGSSQHAFLPSRPGRRVAAPAWSLAGGLGLFWG